MLLVVKLAEEKAALTRQVAERDAVIVGLRATLTTLEGTIAALQTSLINHANDVALLRRRLYGAKSERGGTSELQLLLGTLLSDQAALQAQVDQLVIAQEQDAADAAGTSEPEGPPEPPASPPARPPPKGRRDLAASELPVVMVDIHNEALRSVRRQIGWEESRQLMFARSETKVLLLRIAKYEDIVDGEKTAVAAPSPKTLFPRSLLHGSFLAHLAVTKFALGVPHYRLEEQLAAHGSPLDRGTMCRKMEELGNTLGCTIVAAMLRDAMTCQVLSTDATGAAIQPGPREGGPKRPCKKGHFFTIVADCDHVLFEYADKHSQATVEKLFHGFEGFLQADASSVYDILERGPPRDSGEAESAIKMVGCWAHLRRYFFEAAVCKYPAGLQGLLLIQAIYAADNKLKKLSPPDRKRDRIRLVVPLVDAFFAWVKEARLSTPGNNLATKALNYARNQEVELRRVFLDGRIPLDNTRSERALRKIVDEGPLCTSSSKARNYQVCVTRKNSTRASATAAAA